MDVGSAARRTVQNTGKASPRLTTTEFPVVTPYRERTEEQNQINRVDLGTSLYSCVIFIFKKQKYAEPKATR